MKNAETLLRAGAEARSQLLLSSKAVRQVKCITEMHFTCLTSFWPYTSALTCPMGQPQQDYRVLLLIPSPWPGSWGTLTGNS